MGKPKTKQLVAAIYCRTSGDDADLAKQDKKSRDAPGAKVRQSESIAEQEIMCLARCEKMGLKVAGVFKDANLSGRTYPKGFSMADPAFDEYFQAHIKRPSKRVRPALGDLFSLPHVDVIVVRDIYRLLRPAFRSHLGNHIWQMLASRKIQVHSVADGDIDSTKFEDLMLTNLKLAIADQAKRQEVEASIRSLRAKKDDGYLASGVKCYGFRSRKGEPQKVDPVPTELKIVRHIFSQYLAGVKMLVIANDLNDRLKVKTPGGSQWTMLGVRQILLRPYYAGLSRSSQKELIPSKVFPTGNEATVTEAEFHNVLKSFESRMRMRTRTDKDLARQRRQEQNFEPTRGGSLMGTDKSNGIVHPLTGLVKCGCCGKNLYISTATNPYYKTPTVFYYYHCHTPINTKSEKFADCREVRIMEAYPSELVDSGVVPNGNGLLECLFPVLFHGFIHRYIQQATVAPTLNIEREHLQAQLDNIKANEVRLLDQQADQTIDDEQFALGMQRNRDRKAEMRAKLEKVETDIAALGIDGATVPSEQFQNPALIPRETIQELAHATFKEIIVYPMKVRVVLKAPDPKTGKEISFEIARIKRRNSRVLPFWKARINAPELTAASQIGVTYYYKSTDRDDWRDMRVVHVDDHLEIMTLGFNYDKLDKKLAEYWDLPTLSPAETEFCDWAKQEFGPPPTFGRKLQVNAEVFFGTKFKYSAGVDTGE